MEFQNYIIFSTTTTVKILYTLKSGKTGKILWSSTVATQYSPQAANTGNPIANLIFNCGCCSSDRAGEAELSSASAAGQYHWFLHQGPGHSFPDPMIPQIRRQRRGA